jgi:hypothetical protein
MKKNVAIIALLPFLAFGCAVFSGQYRYVGVSGITERTITSPEPPRYMGVRLGGDVWSYFKAKVNKEVYINNGNANEQHYRVICDHAFPSIIEVDVPAYTKQQVLIQTDGEHMYEKLCHREAE